MDAGFPVDFIFLDLSRAFDRVDRDHFVGAKVTKVHLVREQTWKDSLTPGSHLVQECPREVCWDLFSSIF